MLPYSWSYSQPTSDADAEYLSILDEMKVSKKVRLTELENENENARLRDEICDIELAHEAIRKEATEDSDSSSSVPHSLG